MLLAAAIAAGVSATSGAAAAVEGDDPEALRVTLVPTDDTAEVRLVVSPPAELSLLDLESGDFTVTEGADVRPTEVERLAADDLDVTVAVDLADPDGSGAAVRGAADELIRTLPDDSRVGVVIGADPTTNVALTADKGQSLAGLASLAGLGEEAPGDLGAIVETAVAQADAGPGTRPAVVLLSAAPVAEVLDALGQPLPSAAGPVALFVVATGTGPVPDEGPAALVEATGGRTLIVERLEQMVGATDVVSRQLGSQYLLRLGADASRPSELTVAVDRDGVTATATVELAAAPEPDTTPAGGTPAVAFPADTPAEEPSSSDATADRNAGSSQPIDRTLLVGLVALLTVLIGALVVVRSRLRPARRKASPAALATVPTAPAPTAPAAAEPAAVASAPLAMTVAGAVATVPAKDAPIEATPAPARDTPIEATPAPAAPVATPSPPTPPAPSPPSRGGEDRAPADRGEASPPAPLAALGHDPELLAAARRADLELAELDGQLWDRPDAFPLDGLVLRGAVLSAGDGETGASPWQVFRHRGGDDVAAASSASSVERAIDALCWAFRQAASGRLDMALLADLATRRTGRPLRRVGDVDLAPASADGSPSLRAALVRQSVQTAAWVDEADKRWLGRSAALLSLARDGALSAPVLELGHHSHDAAVATGRDEEGHGPGSLASTVDAIATASGESRARLGRLTQVRASGLAATDGSAQSTALVDLVCANPIITVAFAADRLGTSSEAALDLIDGLEAEQWLHGMGSFGDLGLQYWVAPGALSALEDDLRAPASTTT